jgi:hypothetical protein
MADDPDIIKALDLRTAPRRGPRKGLRIYTTLDDGTDAYGLLVRKRTNSSAPSRAATSIVAPSNTAGPSIIVAPTGVEAFATAAPGSEPSGASPDFLGSELVAAETERLDPSYTEHTERSFPDVESPFRCCSLDGCHRRAADARKRQSISFAAFLQEKCSRDHSWPPAAVAVSRTKTVYCVPADTTLTSFVLVTFRTVQFSDGSHVVSLCTCMDDWQTAYTLYDMDSSGWSRAEALEAIGHVCAHVLALQVCVNVLT